MGSKLTVKKMDLSQVNFEPMEGEVIQMKENGHQVQNMATDLKSPMFVLKPLPIVLASSII